MAPVSVLLAPLVAWAQNDVRSGLSRISDLFLGSIGSDPQQDIVSVVGDVIAILLFIAGAIAVLFVIIGGFQYVTSGGNEESAKKGKKTLTNAIIGIVIIILAYAIINVVVNTVGRGCFGIFGC